MKRIIDTANEYVRESDWKDVSLLKLCLCSMGIAIGASLPKKARKPAVFAGATVFFITCVPLIAKFFRIFSTMPKPAAKQPRCTRLGSLKEDQADALEADWNDWE